MHKAEEDGPAAIKERAQVNLKLTQVNLKLTLIFRIICAAAVCLLGAAACIVWQANRDLERNMNSAAEFAARQLDRQLWHISSGFELPERFPEWQPSPALDSAAGLCVSYTAPDGRTGKSVCNGWSGAGSDAPHWFRLLHGWAFDPAREIVRPVSYRNAPKGRITVSPVQGVTAAQAWRDIRGLIGLQLASVAAVSALIYGAVSRALRPADAIMEGFARLEGGDLSVRLPAFQLAEFGRISEGFNRLVTRLQVSVGERNALTARLFQVQEEERRSLARDLHDEFGQCLAGIGALAASIGETAKRRCPELIEEGQAIARTAAHMMGMLRETLVRLRPPEVELGLVESLSGLVAGWNGRLAGKTRFALKADNGANALPGVIGVNVFRIVQECLTNASKHAEASEVRVILERREDGQLALTVEDDGKSDGTAIETGSGVGLLGVRERVAALGGTVAAGRREPSGFRLQALIPVPAREQEAEA